LARGSAHFPGSVRERRLTTGRVMFRFARESVMEGSNIFISSCSRRQLARRRPSRGGGALRLQLLLLVVVLGLALGAYVAGRGGI
jgi:hypothetical protein